MDTQMTHTERDIVFGDGTASPAGTVRCLLVDIRDHIVLHVKALPQTKVVKKSGLVGAVSYVSHGHIS